MAESNSGTGNSVQGFQFLQQKGDLFSCAETDSLAHCVSEDVRMGKGIAVIFKKQFGGVQELKEQGKKTGDVAVLRRGKRFVYYLITKEKANGKPGYDSLRSSLVALRKLCKDDNVTSLSMPRIGCGLDGLQWDKVSTMICDVFSDTNMTITIYTL